MRHVSGENSLARWWEGPLSISRNSALVNLQIGSLNLSEVTEHLAAVHYPLRRCCHSSKETQLANMLIPHPADNADLIAGECGLYGE